VSFHRGLLEEKTLFPFHQRVIEKGFIKTLKFRSEVAAHTLELIEKKQRRTPASLIYLKRDGAKDYLTKALQDFLRQEVISHEVADTYCPQSNGLAERLNLTIMGNVRCMLIDENLTHKLWLYSAHYAVLVNNNITHSAFDN